MRLLPLALLLAACAAAEPEPPAGIGQRTLVQILDGGFVRFEGRRVPTEAFLLEVRRRVRAAAGDADRIPWILVRAEDGVQVSPEQLELITRELGKAGVRHVHLGRE